MVPALVFPLELLVRAQGASLGMKCAIFDVDGVLTDGRLYIGEQGETFKAFHALDGHGLKLLAQNGIRPVVITGRDSPAVRRRMADLGIADAMYGIADKWAAAQSLLQTHHMAWTEVCVMGDDWPDLPLMRQAALAVAPPHAHAEVRAVAQYITTARGGEGAVRECCDLLLTAAGRYAQALQSHLQTLDGR